MLAFFQNIGMPETVLIVIVSILIFGKRLPEVAARFAVQAQRARRAMTDLRRETGIDAELREARRAINEAVSLADKRPFELARAEDKPPEGSVQRAQPSSEPAERAEKPKEGAEEVDEPRESSETERPGETSGEEQWPPDPFPRSGGSPSS